MNDYTLITFDMDGTLLNSKKEIQKSSIEAIRVAKAAGKEIAFCSGRGLPGILEYAKILPEIRYAILVSGAIVYDLKEEKYIYSNMIDQEVVRQLLAFSQMDDIMVQLLGKTSEVQANCVLRMEDFYMGQYRKLYDDVCIQHENLVEAFDEAPKPFPKVNLFHTSVEARNRTEERLKNAELPITVVHSEITSLECNAIGTNKGTGLQKLCEHLGITVDQVISVGDADNDLMVLQTAGMAIAMGNSNENVLKIADAVVGDNDHDGCAEAIYKYLLH